MAVALPVLTTDELARRQAASRAARRVNRARLRSDKGKARFHPDDVANWGQLAVKAGIKLPPFGVPVSTAAIKRWLTQLGIPVPEYLRYEQEGPTTLKEIAARYDVQRWPLKAWVGLMLEYLERKGQITPCHT